MNCWRTFFSAAFPRLDWFRNLPGITLPQKRSHVTGSLALELPNRDSLLVENTNWSVLLSQFAFESFSLLAELGDRRNIGV